MGGIPQLPNAKIAMVFPIQCQSIVNIGGVWTAMKMLIYLSTICENIFCVISSLNFSTTQQLLTILSYAKTPYLLFLNPVNLEIIAGKRLKKNDLLIIFTFCMLMA